MILLSRPQAQANRFADQLVAANVAREQIAISPALTIQGVGKPSLHPGVGLVTSQNATTYLPEGLSQAYCVGPATADALRLVGVSVLAQFETVGDLQAHLLTTRPSDPLHHYRGEHVTSQLSQTLQGAGLISGETVVYRQIAQDLTPEALTLLQGGSRVDLPLFSRRTAQVVCRQHNNWKVHRAFSISQPVAEICEQAGFEEIHVASEPNAAALVKLILRIR